METKHETCEDRIGDATYSPEDNKFRLYPHSRLVRETYEEIRGFGFRWAPRQKLFVCPRWTPQVEDFLLKHCGEIMPEGMSLEDRAEHRAQWAKEKSAKRLAESKAHHAQADRMGELMNGQPILVGHHSEKRHRRDYQRMWDHVHKGCELWRTSNYWVERAASAKAHASYKNDPAVRVRRIKRLEANLRTWQRRAGILPPSLAERKSADVYQPTVTRWIEHYEGRLVYEKALLDNQGSSHLLEKPKRPKAPPILNYRAESIKVRNRYNRGEVQTMGQVKMTRAEYAKVWKDNKATWVSADGSHRLRGAMHRENGKLVLSLVFLTDSKVHERPERHSK